MTETYLNTLTGSKRPIANKAIVILPIIALSGYAVLQLFPLTRWRSVRIVQENGPVELLTFAALLFGGLITLGRSWTWYKNENISIPSVLLALLGIGFIFISMEEISWGQQFLKFETPDTFQSINIQGETTLHNIEGMHGHASFLYLIFAIGGLCSYTLYRTDFGIASLDRLSPPPSLISFFAVVGIFGLVKLHTEFASVSAVYMSGVRWTSEVAEMLISVAAILYAVSLKE